PGDPCQNMGFESNNFNGWELYYGTRTTGNFTTSGWTAGTNAPINNSGGTAAQHAIVTAGNDPNVGAALQRVPPGGGTYAARLGDNGTAANPLTGTAAS